MFLSWLKSACLINIYKHVYHIALKFHKKGFTDVAKRTYKQLMDLSGVDNEIMGWVYFKYGEIFLKERNKGAAANMFRTALKYKPNLYKAQIYLNPDTEPLNILISYPQFDERGYLCIEMDVHHMELWDYYFQDMCLDSLYLPSFSDYGYGIDEFRRIIECASNYINTGGTIKVKCDNTLSDNFNIKQLIEIADNSGFVSNKEYHPALTSYDKNQFIQT